MRVWHAVFLLPACGAAPAVDAPLPVALAGQGNYLWTQPRSVPEAAAPAPGGTATLAASNDGEGKSEATEEPQQQAQEESQPAEERSGIDTDLDDE